MDKKLIKNKIGRPTNYSEELCTQANQYLKDFKKDEPVPTIAGLAFFLKIPRQKIYEYKEKYEEFRDIVEFLMGLQEMKLLSGSLTNKLNSKISTLMLTKHGYTNKEEVEHSGRFSLKALLHEADMEEKKYDIKRKLFE